MIYIVVTFEEVMENSLFFTTYAVFIKEILFLYMSPFN